MQAAGEHNEQKILQLGEPSSSVAAANGDDHSQTTSGSVQGVEDCAAADLHEAEAATTSMSGDSRAAAQAAAEAADAVLDSKGSTAAPGAGSGCPQDSAEGNSRSIQVRHFHALMVCCLFLPSSEQFDQPGSHVLQQFHINDNVACT